MRCRRGVIGDPRVGVAKGDAKLNPGKYVRENLIFANDVRYGGGVSLYSLSRQLGENLRRSEELHFYLNTYFF